MIIKIILIFNKKGIETDDDGFLILLYTKTGEKINYRKDIDTEKMKSQMNFICENHDTLTKKTEQIGNFNPDLEGAYIKQF